MVDPLIVQLSLRWLTAPDACSASCVSKEWSDLLQADKSGLWKQICLNTHPKTSATFLAVEQDKGATDFRRLTRSLAKTMPERQDTSPTTQSLADMNMFAIIELYERPTVQGKRRHVSLGSWSCPVQSPELSLDLPVNERLVLRGANPNADAPEFTRMADEDEALEHYREFWENHEYADAYRGGCHGPVGFGLQDAIGTVAGKHDESDQLRIKVTLFRRDNMKSVCVMDHAAGMNEIDYSRQPDLVLHSYFFGDDDVVRMDDETETGRNAILALWAGNHRYISEG